MSTILTDNIFKLWCLSLAKCALHLSDGTTASIASPQCILEAADGVVTYTDCVLKSAGVIVQSTCAKFRRASVTRM